MGPCFRRDDDKQNGLDHRSGPFVNHSPQWLLRECSFQHASGLKIEPDRETTHRVRPKLTVVERDFNKAIVTAVLWQSGFPSQRTITVEADQVFKAVLLAGVPIEKDDPAIREVK
jgi:hypothetical protein